jgi:hypothetical protein
LDDGVKLILVIFLRFISTRLPRVVSPGLTQGSGQPPIHGSGLFFLATQGRVKHYLEARSEKIDTDQSCHAIGWVEFVRAWGGPAGRPEIYNKEHHGAASSGIDQAEQVRH